MEIDLISEFQNSKRRNKNVGRLNKIKNINASLRDAREMPDTNVTRNLHEG